MGKLRPLTKLSASLRWKLGMRVAAPELENGTDESISQFYGGGITDCSFVGKPNHYEHPRGQGILDKNFGGVFLEVWWGQRGVEGFLSQ